MDRKLVRGKVAKVLNDMAVALNLGRVDGLREGMVFDVLSDGVAYDVRDPDTGEILGSVGRPKARVRVGHVGERIAIARAHDTRLVNVGGLGDDIGPLRSDLDRLFEPAEWVSQPKKLKSQQMAWDELPEFVDEIMPGDIVEEVSGEMADLDIEHSAHLLPITRHEVG